eukprot:5884463-Alexandrium_andersonii.AAC.1
MATRVRSNLFDAMHTAAANERSAQNRQSWQGPSWAELSPPSVRSPTQDRSTSRRRATSRPRIHSSQGSQDVPMGQESPPSVHNPGANDYDKLSQ